MRGADGAIVGLGQGRVKLGRQAHADQQANTTAKVGAIMKIIEKTAFIENLLASQMSPGMAAALDWSRAVETRSLTH